MRVWKIRQVEEVECGVLQHTLLDRWEALVCEAAATARGLLQSKKSFPSTSALGVRRISRDDVVKSARVNCKS